MSPPASQCSLASVGNPFLAEQSILFGFFLHANTDTLALQGDTDTDTRA